jgi:hypothetical protein
MIPKLNFTYSYIYDSMFAKRNSKKYSDKAKIEARAYIKALKNEFSRYSNSVLSCIGKVSGLKWYKREIHIYILFHTTGN